MLYNKQLIKKVKQKDYSNCLNEKKIQTMNIHSRFYRLYQAPLEKGVGASALYFTHQTQTTIQLCIQYVTKHMSTLKFISQ